MADNEIYFGINPVYPPVFKRENEDWPDVDDKVYLVLWPYLRQEDAEGSPNLIDYLVADMDTFWEVHKPKLAADKHSTESAEVEEEVKEDAANRNTVTSQEFFCPVPLPPKTQLQLKIAYEEDGTDEQTLVLPSSKREIGAEKPFAPENKEIWVDIAKKNSLRFPKFASMESEGWLWPNGEPRLQPDEQRNLLEWGVGIISRELSRDAEAFPPDEDLNIVERFSVGLLKGADIPTPLPKVDQRSDWPSLSGWKNLLLPDSNAQQPPVWELFLKVREFQSVTSTSPKQKAAYSLPQYEYTESELKDNASVFFSEGNDSYAEHFWKGFSARAKEVNRLGSGQEEDLVRAQQELELSQALIRAFAVGERWVWSIPADEINVEKDLMLLPDKGLEAGWRWTNLHSLCGLAFGIDIDDFKKLDGNVKNVELSIGGHTLTLSDQAISKLINDFNEDIRNVTDEIKMPLGGNFEDNLGRVLFKPRITTYDPIASVPQGLEAWSVPTSVLDALEKESEFVLPSGEQAEVIKRKMLPFVKQTPQRMLLAQDELLLSGDKDDFLEHLAIRLRARIAPVPQWGQTILSNKSTYLRVTVDQDVTGDGDPDDIHFKDFNFVKDILSELSGDAEDSEPYWTIWYSETKEEEGASADAESDVIEEVSLKLDKLNVEPDFLLNPFSFLIRLEDESTDDDDLIDEGLKKLKDWVALKSKQESETARATAQIELIYRPSNPPFRFNSIIMPVDAEPRQAPFITLNRFFEYDFWNSTEHVYRRFWFNWKETGNEVTDSMSQAIKCWGYICFPSSDKAKEIRLTRKDHLLPRIATHLDRDDVAAQNEGELAVYECWHSFGGTDKQAVMPSNEEDRKSRIAEKAELEEERYLAFKHAGWKATFDVALDHQYGYRLREESGDTRPLRLFSSISHPSELIVERREKNDADQNKDVSNDEPFFTFHLTEPRSGQPQALILRFSNIFIQRALKPHLNNHGSHANSIDIPQSAIQPADEPDYQLLRTIYQTFFDLSTEEGTFWDIINKVEVKKPANKLSLIIEVWNFYNLKPDSRTGVTSASPFDALDQRMPSLLEALRFEEFWTFSLNENEEFKKLVSSVVNQKTWEAFRDHLGTLIDNDNLTFTIPIDGSAKWDGKRIDDSDIPNSVLAESYMSRRANALRVGLLVEREALRCPDKSSAVKGDEDVYLYQVQLEDGVEGIGIPDYLEKDKNDLDQSQKEALRKLKAEAAKRANRLLAIDEFKEKASDVRKEFKWIRAHEKLITGLSEKSKERVKRHRSLFGPAFPFTTAPKGVRKPENLAVVRLFSIPTAFIPIRRWAALEDRTRTIQFVYFLTDLLEQLSSGKPVIVTGVVTGVEPLIEDNVESEDKNQHLNQVRKSASELKASVASTLARQFLKIVEDDDSDAGELRGNNWKGRSGFDNPTDVEEQRALLTKVRGLRRHLLDEEEAPVRQAVKNVLQNDLSIYGRAKGFAVHLLDQEDHTLGLTANHSLYNLLITKFVRQDLMLRPHDIVSREALADRLKRETDELLAFKEAIKNIPGLSENGVIQSLVGENWEEIVTEHTNEDVAGAFRLLVDVDGRDGLFPYFETFLGIYKSESIEQINLALDQLDIIKDNPKLETLVPTKTIDYWKRRMIRRRNRLILQIVFAPEIVDIVKADGSPGTIKVSFWDGASVLMDLDDLSVPFNGATGFKVEKREAIAKDIASKTPIHVEFNEPIAVVTFADGKHADYLLPEMVWQDTSSVVKTDLALLSIAEQLLSRSRSVWPESGKQTRTEVNSILRPFQQLDADRFAYNRIQYSDRNHAFMLDVLDDETYDSEYEILPCGVLGRTAEDIIEGVNSTRLVHPKRVPDESQAPQPDLDRDLVPMPAHRGYKDVPTAMDRNIHVITQPHNPEWREWRNKDLDVKTGEAKPLPISGGDVEEVRWYYILPSRLAPAEPVPRKPAEGVDDDGKVIDVNRRLINSEPTFPDPPSAISEQLFVDHYEKRHHEEAFIGSLGNIQFEDMNDSDALVPETNSDTLINDYITWQAVNLDDSHDIDVDYKDDPDYIKAYLWRKHARGWQWLESYVTDFFFEVQPDEEFQQGGDILDGFRNDTFRIELEEVALDEVPPQSQADLPKINLDEEPLLKWYKYLHAQDEADKTKEGEEVPKPPTMSAGKLRDELEKYLEPGEKCLLKPSSSGLPLLENGQKTMRRRVMRFRVTSDGKMSMYSTRKSAIEKEHPRPEMGRILDANLYSYENDSDESKHVIMRVSVLCSAYYRYRVRMQVSRNTRDVDHDGDSDMNPLFRMDSGNSPWVDHGVYRVLRSPLIEGSLPKQLQFLQGGEDSSPKKEWLSATLDTEEASTLLGNPLKFNMDCHPYYWGIRNLEPIRKQLEIESDPDVINPNYTGALSHLAYLPDRNMPFDLHKDELETRNAIRDQYQTRAISRARLNDQGLGKMFRVKKGDAPGSSKAFKLVFKYKETFNFLTIDNWRYRWKKPDE